MGAIENSMTRLLLLLMIAAVLAEPPLTLFSGSSSPNDPTAMFASTGDTSTPDKAAHGLPPLSLNANPSPPNPNDASPLSLSANSGSQTDGSPALSLNAAPDGTQGTTSESLGYPGEISLKVGWRDGNETLVVPPKQSFDEAAQLFLKKHGVWNAESERKLVAQLVLVA